MSETAPARCRNCEAPLRERQRWCLACGAGAPRQVAVANGWRTVSALATIAVAAVLAAIGYAAAALVS